MKILFNTSNFPKWKGEATTPFIFTLANKLNSNKCNIEVLAPHAQNSKKFEIWNGVKIHRYQYAFPAKIQVLFAGGGALSSLRANKFGYLLIVPFLISQFFNLLKLQIKNNYSIIHSHWLIPQGFIGLLVANIFQIPHVVSIHGADLFTFENKFFLFFKKIVLKHSDIVICNSPFTKSELTKRFSVDSKKVKIIPALTNNFFYKKNVNLKNKRNIQVLFVGRIVEEKGLGIIIRSLKKYDDQFSSKWKLTVAGAGKRLGYYKKLSSDLNLANKISFLGWVDQKKLPELFAKNDLFIGISKESVEGWKEAMGITYLEALFSGIKVIATEEVGLLSYFSKKELEKLQVFVLKKPYTAIKTAKLINKAKLTHSMNTEENIIEILNKFTSNEIINKYNKLYNSLL